LMFHSATDSSKVNLNSGGVTCVDPFSAIVCCYLKVKWMRMNQENGRVLPDIGANSTCHPQRNLVNYVVILRQKRLETGINIESYRLMPTFNKLLSNKVASARLNTTHAHLSHSLGQRDTGEAIIHTRYLL
jgi:hypothetical protein